MKISYHPTHIKRRQTLLFVLSIIIAFIIAIIIKPENNPRQNILNGCETNPHLKWCE